MELSYKQADNPGELRQILTLQADNLPAKLSAAEQEREGFVTVRHNFQLLNRMNSVCAHILAKDGADLAGYALCMHPCFREDIPVLRPMFEKLDHHLPDKSRYMVMGQVCVHKDYRGKGVFRGLYAHMCELLRKEYDFIVTEVDTRNSRSLQAHKAVGFTTLCRYRSGEQDWSVISLHTSLPTVH